MKRNELIEIKNLGLSELIKKAQELRQEVSGLIMDKNMKKLKDLKSISKKRKNLAQVLTVIRQKRLLEMLELKIPKMGDRTKLSKVK